MVRGRRIDAAVLLAAVGLFLGLALYQIDLPGLYHDEAQDAVPAMQFVRGQPVQAVRDATIGFGGRRLPLMVAEYQGAINTYLLVPFFAVFGVKVSSLRLMPVLASALTIVVSYFLARGLFDRGVATVTVVLMAVHPSFIFMTREGIYVSTVLGLLAMGSLLSLYQWHVQRKDRFLYLGLFLLGLGLSAKLLFVWFIVALGILFVTLLWQPWRRRRDSDPPPSNSLPPGEGGPNRKAGGASSAPTEPVGATGGRPCSVRRRSPSPFTERGPGGEVVPILLSTLTFLAGASVLLLYNLRTGGTIDVLRRNFAVSANGVNNFDVLGNLVMRLQTFRDLLRGDTFWYLGGAFANPVYPAALGIAVAVILAVLALNPESRRGWRHSVLPLGIMALVLLQGFATVSGIWSTHLFLLLPLPQMTIAIALFLLARHGPERRLGLAAGAAIVAALFILDLGVVAQYHQAMRNTGGLGAHSDAIYALAGYVDARGAEEPLAMDWGVKNAVQVLTQGQVNPVEIFQYTPQPDQTFLDWLYGALTKTPDRLYLFHAPEFTHYQGRFAAFEDLAAKLERTPKLEAVFHHRDGTPALLVYSAHPR